ncbi:MAG: DUF86 domain-containing protein [Lachnospiraceae bacterium]|nr:DUF86 domain-containing protein [Lachnospiraceae bacterium]
MDNIKNDSYFAIKILEDLKFIMTHMSNVDSEEFSKDEVLQDSMMFRLIQISENSKKLSDDFKLEHAAIPWTAVYGLRNRIVHDYGSVDLGIVFDTLKVSIPELQELLSREINA